MVGSEWEKGPTGQGAQPGLPSPGCPHDAGGTFLRQLPCLSHYGLSGGTGLGYLPAPPTHLKALRVDLFPLLVPGHPWLGVPRGLAHKGSHTSRHTDLVFGLLDEPGGLWGESRKKRGPGGPREVARTSRGHANKPPQPLWPRSYPSSKQGWRAEEGEEMLSLTVPTPQGTYGYPRVCTALPHQPHLDQQPHSHRVCGHRSCGLTRSVPQGRVQGETP